MVFFKPIKIDFGPFLDTVASKYESTGGCEHVSFFCISLASGAE